MAGLASLLPLLQSSMGGADAAPNPEEMDPNVPYGGEIPVNANKWKPEFSQEQPELLPSYRNDYLLEEIDRAAAYNPERKGMFGVKGTLRDILGTVGDAFLLQSGNEAIYRPQRQIEKTGDAMVGFAQGTPEEKMAAIERVMRVNPAYGQKLAEQYATATNNEMKARAQMANYGSLADSRTFKQMNDLSKFGANMLNGATDEADIGYALNVIESRLPEGVTLEDLGLSRDMTVEEAQQYATSGIDRYKQESLPINQQKADASTMNAESSRIRANKPSPRPRADTRNEDFRKASAVPPEKRTEAEKAIVAAGPTGQNNSSGGGSSTRRDGRIPVTKYEGWSFKEKK